MTATMTEPTAQSAKAKPKYRFKLLAGRHIAEHPDHPKDPRKELRYCANPDDPAPNAGNIIETDLALDEMFNTPSSRKFERLGGSYEPPVDPLAQRREETPTAYAKRLQATAKELAAKAQTVLPAFDKMSYQEIKEYAEAEEIDLGGAKTKDEAVKAVKKALQPAP